MKLKDLKIIKFIRNRPTDKGYVGISNDIQLILKKTTRLVNELAKPVGTKRTDFDEIAQASRRLNIANQSNKIIRNKDNIFSISNDRLSEFQNQLKKIGEITMKTQEEKILKEIKKLKDTQNTWVGKLKDLENLISKPELPSFPFWAIFRDCAGVTRLERVIKYSNGAYYTDNNCCFDSVWFKGIATPEEIETHLIGLAKEKYKEGDEVASILFDGGNKVGIGAGDDFYYDASDDMLMWGYPCIYKQGKWAKTVPSFPSWDELGVSNRNYSINGLKYSEKMFTLARLLAVADYVNDLHKVKEHATFFYFELEDNYLSIENYNTGYSCSPYRFNTKDAAHMAIDFFRHNDSEQELIDFFK